MLKAKLHSLRQLAVCRIFILLKFFSSYLIFYYFFCLMRFFFSSFFWKKQHLFKFILLIFKNRNIFEKILLFVIIRCFFYVFFFVRTTNGYWRLLWWRWDHFIWLWVCKKKLKKKTQKKAKLYTNTTKTDCEYVYIHIYIYIYRCFRIESQKVENLNQTKLISCETKWNAIEFCIYWLLSRGVARRSFGYRKINYFCYFSCCWFSISIIKAFIFKCTKTKSFYLCIQPKLAQLFALLTAQIPNLAREWD